MSPTAWLLQPSPTIQTSLFSSVKPSLHTEAAQFSCHSWSVQPTHFLMAESGHLPHPWFFPSTIPFEWKVPPERLVLFGGYRAAWQHEDEDTCPTCRSHRPRSCTPSLNNGESQSEPGTATLAKTSLVTFLHLCFHSYQLFKSTNSASLFSHDIKVSFFLKKNAQICFKCIIKNKQYKISKSKMVNK